MITTSINDAAKGRVCISFVGDDMQSVVFLNPDDFNRFCRAVAAYINSK